MGDTVQQHAALIAKSGRGVGGRDPAVLDLGTVGIEVRVLAGALEDDKVAALLVDVEATFFREKEIVMISMRYYLRNCSTYPRTESPACQSP